MDNLTIKETAMCIAKTLNSKKLIDNTLENLLRDCKLSNDDELYNGLNLLAKENKIVLLITPVETYVLPLIG